VKLGRVSGSDILHLHPDTTFGQRNVCNKKSHLQSGDGLNPHCSLRRHYPDQVKRSDFSKPLSAWFHQAPAYQLVLTVIILTINGMPYQLQRQPETDTPADLLHKTFRCQPIGRDVRTFFDHWDETTVMATDSCCV